MQEIYAHLLTFSKIHLSLDAIFFDNKIYKSIRVIVFDDLTMITFMRSMRKHAMAGR